MILTADKKCPIHCPKGGGYMGGHYRFDDKAGRFYVCVYWQKKKYRIFRYLDEPIWHEKTASKLLNKIRAEIDDGTFDIRAYLPESPLTLKAFSETWLKASSACANTKRVHRSAIKKAIEAWGENMDIRTMSHSKLAILHNSMKASVKWKNSVLIALKAMMNYAVKDGVIKKLPPFPALSESQEKNIEYLTFDEQKKVIEAIPERHRAVFMFGMEYGLRIGEIRALKKDCIENSHVIIKRSFSQWELRETTKTYRIRRLPLTARAKEILRTAPPSFSEYLFTLDGKLPYYERKMREIWKEACDEVGIKINQKNAIRHSLGCQLLDDGVDLEMVRDIYGHTSTDMTRKYVKRTPRRMLEALEKRGQLVEFTARILPESKNDN
jgi:integrase